MMSDKSPEHSQVHRREKVFHDDWARTTKVEEVAVREAFEAPAAMENRFILKRMGDITGKDILDVGAGLGESSVYFALRGAKVTATDISPGMLEFTQRLAAYHGVHVDTIVSTAERLAVPPDHYDFVYAANLLHHLTDRATFFAQVARVLKPGGRFFSWDPLAYNPLINIYRKMATEVRSPDERPLSFADVAVARRYLSKVGHREFWIASLVIFLKFYIVDRVHPNEDRYWKRILGLRPAQLWWWLPLRIVDSLILTRLPLVRRMAWNIVLFGDKRPSDGRVA